MSWIDEVAKIQTKHVLFLAEGLFMYLTEKDVTALFKKLGDVFSLSQIQFEVVHKKYTRGFYKRLVERKMQKRMGSSAGSAYNYGVESGLDISGYHPNLKVIEEWSYIEDKRVRPKFLSRLKTFKTFTRSQWTIRAEIGEKYE